jgi:hypothetical protein
MIETRTQVWSGYRGMGEPQEVEVPVVQEGDRVELSGWDEPVIGRVIHCNQKLVWCDVPVATPGGGAHVCSMFAIKKLWRGNDYWEPPYKAD